MILLIQHLSFMATPAFLSVAANSFLGDCHSIAFKDMIEQHEAIFDGFGHDGSGIDSMDSLCFHFDQINGHQSQTRYAAVHFDATKFGLNKLSCLIGSLLCKLAHLNYLFIYSSSNPLKITTFETVMPKAILQWLLYLKVHLKSSLLGEVIEDVISI